MNYALNQRIVLITPPGAIVDNAAFVTATIDTRGFRHLRILAHFGAMDIAMAAIRAQESDAPDMSGAADIPGTIGGTNFTLPTATADNTFGAINIQLKGGRRRYIDLVATGGDGTTGTYMTAIAILSRPEEATDTPAKRGMSFEVNV